MAHNLGHRNYPHFSVALLRDVPLEPGGEYWNGLVGSPESVMERMGYWQWVLSPAGQPVAHILTVLVHNEIENSEPHHSLMEEEVEHRQ